ncbi:ORF6N domain-containing protein [bacterium]|nr:ORF6N domain-containing protein [bacterium]
MNAKVNKSPSVPFVQKSLIGKIERRIYIIRGRRVMLDSDLAEIYGVTTARLNEQVKRNPERFPPEFVFRITKREWDSLMSQFAISKGRGGRRKLPRVFTKDGAVMLATVLKTSTAAEVTLQVVRAFNRMQEILEAHLDVATKIRELEKMVGKKFRKHEKAIQIIFDALHQLMNPPMTPVVGFVVDSTDAGSHRTRSKNRRRS